MKLEDKVAIVTGASRGIGRAVALAFAREGAHVTLAARSEPELADLAEEIRELGRKAVPAKVDVSQEDEVERMVQRTLEELDTVDILFNGAGVGYVGTVVEMPVELWDETFDVNMRGTFLCCRYVLPIMMAKKRGSIVNVASTDRGHATKSAYRATKFGVVAFTQALAEEVAPHNIAVNCVRFGIVVDTELGRALNPGADRSGWQKPEDITDIIVLLTTQDASGVTGGYVNIREWQKQIRGPLGFAATSVPDDLKGKAEVL